MIQPTQPKSISAPLKNPVPTRFQLEMMLENDLVEPVRSLIREHSLQIDVQQSNGEASYKDMIVPLGKYYLKDRLSRGELHLETFITEDETTLRMKDDAKRIAKTSYEVLITGETGTGKEIIGKSMIGERKGLTLAVNCGAFPENLIESELFGHIKGAFTGADRDKEGLCSKAAEGIMFLDEIGDMPLTVQVKLLRAIQEKRIRKVGATTDEEISCRFVCATHRNIEKMVDEGHFRRDLYARISTLELHINPLRDRPKDILPIIRSMKGHEKFLEQHESLLLNGALDLSLNVRSLQRYIVRYNVLGRI